MWKREVILEFLIVCQFHPAVSPSEFVYTHHDVLLGLLATFLGQKGRLPVEAFIQDDANALLVTSPVVLLAKNNFRGHILACPNNRPRRGAVAMSVSPADEALQVLILCQGVLSMPVKS